MMGTRPQQVEHHHREQQRCVWIVGDEGTGKKSLVAALGAIASVATTGDQGQSNSASYYAWHLAPTLASVKVVVCQDAAQLQLHPQHDSDIHLLCFDLSDHASFAAITIDWCKLLHRSPCQTVLVGTNCECACSSSRTRQVAAAQAMELALVECDEYVEVCSACPSSDGVVYLRQLLAMWLAQDAHTPADPPLPPSPSSSSSSFASVSSSPLPSPRRETPQKRCGVRTSVWLYDPADEVDGVDNHHQQQHADVKLRPISRALFEMREASGDRSKSLERRREQSVHKLVTRSRYYGPTESSRSMRWQVHQQQQSQLKQSLVPATKATSSSSSIQRGRRQSTSDIDGYQADHARLETKSFMQTTKLSKQRMDETRNAQKGVDKPTSSKNSQTNGSRSRTRAMTSTTHCPVSIRPRTASSLSRSSPQLRPVVFSLLDDDAASEFALNVMAPSVEKTLVAVRSTTPPASSESSPSPSPARGTSMWSDSSGESSDDDVQAVAPLPKAQSPVQVSPFPSPSPPPSPPPLSPLSPPDLQDNSQDISPDLDNGKEQDKDEFSSEIDDMLDYFDGVTLPI